MGWVAAAFDAVPYCEAVSAYTNMLKLDCETYTADENGGPYGPISNPKMFDARLEVFMFEFELEPFKYVFTYVFRFDVYWYQRFENDGDPKYVEVSTSGDGNGAT
jgi:hypothetical protein